MKETLVAIILAIIASAAAILSFIQFLITRRDKKKGAWTQLTADMKDTKAAVSGLSMDLCRLQLLLLIYTSPKSAADILPLAFHYFVELNGDQFLTTLFSDWLRTQNINKPIWFKEEHK